MFKSIIAAGFVTVAVLCSGSADAKAKHARPIVCFDFTETTMTLGSSAPRKVAVCNDKNVILTSYKIETWTDTEEGVSTVTRMAVGHR